MDENDRGRLFLPYAALVGFDELVAKQTQVTERRRERSDEENELLSRQVLSLRRGMQVRVTWYENGFYRTCTGTVQRVAVAERTLTLDRKTLSFDDLYAVEEMTWQERLRVKSAWHIKSLNLILMLCKQP